MMILCRSPNWKRKIRSNCIWNFICLDVNFRFSKHYKDISGDNGIAITYSSRRRRGRKIAVEKDPFEMVESEEDEDSDDDQEKKAKKERKKATEETLCMKCSKSSNPEVVMLLTWFWFLWNIGSEFRDFLRMLIHLWSIWLIILIWAAICQWLTSKHDKKRSENVELINVASSFLVF